MLHVHCQRLISARLPVHSAIELRELLEIVKDSAELWKLQSFFLLLVFKLVERPKQRNGFHSIPLVCLPHDIVELRDRAIRGLIFLPWPPRIVRKRMASKNDVLRVRPGLKHSRAGEAIADANSLFAAGTAEAHVVRSVDGDEPVWSIKDFVPNEPASHHT